MSIASNHRLTKHITVFLIPLIISPLYSHSAEQVAASTVVSNTSLSAKLPLTSDEPVMKIPIYHGVTMPVLETSQEMINAVLKNKLPEVENALKNGADVNTHDDENRSLLLLATRTGKTEMAKLLIKYGADVNQQDIIMDSPFLYAGASGQTELVELYLAHGARFTVFNRYHGTALIPAAERGHVATVRLLANTPGYPIDHINRLGWTALMEAVLLGDGSAPYVEIVAILINAGCNINIPDKNGITALAHAKKSGYDQIVKLLAQAEKKQFPLIK